MALGRAYLLPPLSSGGALLVQPWLRFHIHRVTGGGHPPRFPQNVACGFTAPRSSAVGSQHCKCLQLPVREAQFRLQQRCPFFDLVEGVPGEASACPTAATQHSAPVTLYGPINFYETPEKRLIRVDRALDAKDRKIFTLETVSLSIFGYG